MLGFIFVGCAAIQNDLHLSPFLTANRRVLVDRTPSEGGRQCWRVRSQAESLDATAPGFGWDVQIQQFSFDFHAIFTFVHRNLCWYIYLVYIHCIIFICLKYIYECIYTSQGSSWLLSEVEPKFLVQVPTFLQDPSAAAHAVPTFWNSLSPANRVQFEKDFPQFMKLGLRTVKACERHLANVEN